MSPYTTRSDFPPPPLARYEPGYATRLELYDARETIIHLTHYEGSNEVSLNIPDTRRRRLVIDRGLAWQLSHICDHLHRHGTLVRQFPEPDYMI